MRKSRSQNAYNPRCVIDIGRAKRPHARACDWPGCDGEGEHRAPKARDRLNEYYWFCMDHVREYNGSWNYYAGMSDAQVEADRRRDTVWDRPTWRLGGAKVRGGPTLDDLDDPFGVFEDEKEGESPKAPRGSTAEEEALAVLDLRPPLDAVSVKTRYKELVKRHHPDLNGGDKEAEERFKKINQAYQVVMETLA